MKKKDIIKILTDTLREEIAFWRTLAQDTQAELNRAKDASLCLYHRGLIEHTSLMVSSCRMCGMWGSATVIINPGGNGFGGTTSANAPYTLTQTTQTTTVDPALVPGDVFPNTQAAVDVVSSMVESNRSVLARDPSCDPVLLAIARGKELAAEAKVEEARILEQPEVAVEVFTDSPN